MKKRGIQKKPAVQDRTGDEKEAASCQGAVTAGRNKTAVQRKLAGFKKKKKTKPAHRQKYTDNEAIAAAEVQARKVAEEGFVELQAPVPVAVKVEVKVEEAEADGTQLNPVVIEDRVHIPALRNPGKRRGLHGMVNTCSRDELQDTNVL